MKQEKQRTLIVERDADGSWIATPRRVVETISKFFHDRAIKRAARQSFPNNLGNYPGKRTPKPAGKPLTPEERFLKLVNLYAAHRRIRRCAIEARRET